MPVQGMRSGVDKSILTPGWFQLLKNLRCDDGLPVARSTEALILSKPSWATSAAPLGARTVSVNGAQYEVAVWSDGSKARIAVAPSDLSRWVEVTGTGQWTGTGGNNRLDDADNHCQITVMRTSKERYVDSASVVTFASRDVVLIQNGEDYPRIWDPNTQYEIPYTVTGAVSNGGLIRLTIGAGHNFNTGDHVYVSGVGGVPNATGLWQVTDISSTVIDLQGSTFAGLFTSGGTVYDRADVLVEKPIEDTSAAGDSFATVNSYAAIAGGSGTTYPGTADPLQTADFRFGDSSTAGVTPYDGANSVIDWDVTTSAAAGDIAAVQFTPGLVVGDQIIMLVEGANVLSALKQSKIEINEDTVAYASISSAWVTLFDPTGASPIPNQFISITQDSAANRYWVIFDSRHVPDDTYPHIRFTRQGAAPGAVQQHYILFIGSTTGGIPSSTLWGYHYEDALNKVEQRFHTMRAQGYNVGSLGGPQLVTTGTANVSTAAPTLPLVDTFNANFHFMCRTNTTTAQISGGLDGIPERVAFYGKLPDAPKYYWNFSGTIYEQGYTGAGVRAWGDVTNGDLVSRFPPSFYERLDDLFNYNREAPSAYQVPIPIAATCEYINQRLFVGAVKDATGQYAYSDYYYSWDRNPFRFQQVQEDEFKGGYGQIAGEKVQAFRFSASGALGSGRVFMFSDQWLYSMGESGPYATAGLAASEIGRPVRIGPHGTLSPRSPAVGYNAMVWVDQDAQVIRLSNGGLQNISRGQVDDRFESSVASRKPSITGAFWKDRFYIGYTPSGQTTNERVLVWNERMQAWESEDYEDGSANFELLHVWNVTPGVITASRLFVYDTAGSLFGYEEDSTGTVATGWTTGSYNFDKWSSWYISKAIMSASFQATTGSLSRISSKWGASEPWTTTISMNESGAVIATYLDSVAHTKTGTERQELDWEWYLDYTATVAPGTKIRRLEFEAQESNVTAGLGT